MPLQLYQESFVVPPPIAEPESQTLEEVEYVQLYVDEVSEEGKIMGERQQDPLRIEARSPTHVDIEAQYGVLPQHEKTLERSDKGK